MTQDGFRILTLGQWPQLQNLFLDDKRTFTAMDAVTVAQDALASGSCVFGDMLHDLLVFAYLKGNLRVHPMH